MDMFLWITPIPPSRAMAIASVEAVTVSIADDTMGALRTMFLEKREVRSTSRGRTEEAAGRRRTSSNVSPS
jgi:hypothetical protein